VSWRRLFWPRAVKCAQVRRRERAAISSPLGCTGEGRAKLRLPSETGGLDPVYRGGLGQTAERFGRRLNATRNEFRFADHACLTARLSEEWVVKR